MLTGDADNEIRLWDLESRKPVRSFHYPQKSTFAMALLPDGKRFLSAGYAPDGKLWLWDLQGGNSVRCFPAAGGLYCSASVALTADGRRAVCGSYDKALRLWDLETGGELRHLEGHTSFIWSVAVSADGRLAATGPSCSDTRNHIDDSIRLWDLSAGHQIGSYRYPDGESKWVYCLRISSGNRYLYAGGGGGTIYRWRLPKSCEPPLATAPFDEKKMPEPRPVPAGEQPPLATAPFDETKAKEHQEAWAKYLGVPVEMTNAIGMKLVLIPPGEFTIGAGSEDPQGADHEAFLSGQVRGDAGGVGKGDGEEPELFQGAEESGGERQLGGMPDFPEDTWREVRGAGGELPFADRGTVGVCQSGGKYRQMVYWRKRGGARRVRLVREKLGEDDAPGRREEAQRVGALRRLWER